MFLALGSVVRAAAGSVLFDGVDEGGVGEDLGAGEDGVAVIWLWSVCRCLGSR